MAIVAMGLAALVLLLFLAGNNLSMLPRVGELTNTSSSGYGRLITPFVTLFKVLSDAGYLFTANGAGQIPLEFGSAWPLLKLAYEYGITAALSWFLLISASMWGKTNIPFRIATFVTFQFTGGYLLSPAMVLFIVLAFTLYSVRRSTGEAAPNVDYVDAATPTTVHLGTFIRR